MSASAEGGGMQDRVDDAPFDVVLVGEPGRLAEAEQAIALAGGRLVGTVAWHDAASLGERSLGRPVLAVEAMGVAEPLLAAGLPHVAGFATLLDLHVVAVMGRDQIDLVAAELLGADRDLLCAPSLGERVAALAVAGRLADRMTVADRWREGEADRLRKLNEEVARIAERLARLANRGDAGDGEDGVGDRHLAFGYEAPAPDVRPQAIRLAIRGRRLRDSFFADSLFEDPAWDMLLDLYAAHLEGGRVSVSSLCIAAAVAPTTALRWIGKMTELQLFDRHPDPADRRRVFLALSPRALKAMAAYVAATRRAGAPIA